MGSVCIIVVYSVSLRQQLQDVGKKLVGAQHYNKDGSVNNRQDLDYYILYTFSDFSFFNFKRKMFRSRSFCM